MNAPQTFPANLPALIEALPGDHTRAPQTEFTRALQVVFLEALAARGSVRAAARAAGVSHQSVYRLRRANGAFRLAWSGAQLVARARAEDVLASRAIDGVEEQVFYRGEVVATRRRYSDRLLLAHLGRLDRLTDDARVNAFAEDFEGALARYAEGAGAPPRPPATPSANAPPPPAEKTSGQCNTRSMSPAAERPEPCADCGGPCGDLASGPWDEVCEGYAERMEAMFEAHPGDVPWPEEFTEFAAHTVEIVQLAAYEAGVDCWWLVVPPAPGDAPGAWRYANPRAGG